MAFVKNQEAFVYCWTDHKTNMLYVGYHKGRQDDGYICSQDKLEDPDKIPMMVEYRKRPQDFTRMVLAEGTAEDCRALEEVILVAAGAARSNRFYNQHNGGKNFVFDAKGENNPMYGTHRTGIDNPMYGRHHTEETREHLRKISTGKKATQETRDKMSKTRKGKKQSPAHLAKTIENNKKRAGKPMPESAIFKMKEAWVTRKLIPVKQETRDKISAAHKGKKHTEEHIEHMRESAIARWRKGRVQ